MPTKEGDRRPMNTLPTPGEAVRHLMDAGGRVEPADFHQLIGIEHPGVYAWFVDIEGAEHLTDGIRLLVNDGLTCDPVRRGR
jgi:hypothetical protein